MPTGVHRVKNVPRDKVPLVRSWYDLEGPTDLKDFEQSDGKGWTVEATFPGDGETEKEFGAGG